MICFCFFYSVEYFGQVTVNLQVFNLPPLIVSFLVNISSAAQPSSFQAARICGQPLKSVKFSCCLRSNPTFCLHDKYVRIDSRAAHPQPAAASNIDCLAVFDCALDCGQLLLYCINCTSVEYWHSTVCMLTNSAARRGLKSENCSAEYCRVTPIFQSQEKNNQNEKSVWKPSFLTFPVCF